MIDRLMNRKGLLHDPLQPDPDYTLTKAVEAVELVRPFAEPNGELQVMFSPWHHNATYYGFEAQRRAKMGSTVLTIISHPQVIEPNPQRVLDSYKYLVDTAVSTIDEQQADFDRLRLFAASSGTVALAAVAKAKAGEVSSAAMLAGGDSLIDSVWHGQRTILLKSALEADGWTFDKLDELWQPLSVYGSLDAFTGKPVDFVRSTRDLNVLPASQERYSEALRAAGAEVNEHVSHLGHYATIGIALRFGVE
ncbi:MAG TPA: hypothetical protein VG992_01715 [Candidatus Saccharimonadales bacterium]|nr:hypothetical protein [Candidatus Saccharimonadales bacterium]